MKKLGIIASVALGLTSVGLGHLYLQRLEAEVSGGPKVSVLVASRDVPVGGMLKEEEVAIRELPQAYVEQRHIEVTDLKKVLGSRVTAGLRANEAVLWSDLAQFSDKSRVLSGLVTQGMRAVAMDGRDVDFGGLLRPGDRVDVLLTVAGSGVSSTRTLLQNLLVLSVGDNIARAEEEVGRIRNRGTVTLSTSMEGAQVLAQARKAGQLSLSLRNADDIGLVDGLPETSSESLLSEKKTVAFDKSVGANAKGSIDHVR